VFNSPIQAVIFDMDGLVLDTESTYMLAWQQAATRMCFSLSMDFLQSLSGIESGQLEILFNDYCGNSFDFQQFTKLSSNYWHTHVNTHGIPVKPGFFKLLDVVTQLNLPFALATNSRRSNALHCLSVAGVADKFQLIVTRDDVKYGKPAADIYLKTSAMLGVTIEQSLVLEDSVIGVTAATAANALCIYVPSLLPANLPAQCQVLAVAEDLHKVAEYLLHFSVESAVKNWQVK
jgi:HAD superfamily hydrolase (TIGR01509 family)